MMQRCSFICILLKKGEYHLLFVAEKPSKPGNSCCG